ncbi:MAG: MFS transporter [Dysgonamonadaceae bacterium]|jgi:FHS family L-fucose permease-like MFS transporter|nr:MFS transporter [Dysgonamonadaceae bacterium]
MAQEKKNYLLPIIVMILLFGMISFVTGLGGPFADVLQKQFNVPNWQSQLGTFCNFLAYLFMGVPSGIMLKKIGYKKTALVAIVVGFIGVGIQYLSGQAGSFGIYLLGAFVAGFSMCMLNAVVNPMLNTMGGGGNKGNTLIQVGGSFNSLNATIVPVLVGYLAGSTATIESASPALFIAMGIFAFAFVILWLVNIPEPALDAEVKSAEKDKYSALSFRHFVLGAIGIFLYVGVEVGIPNFLILLNTKGLGIDGTTAGSIAGTYWFLMLIGRLIGAAVGMKVSSKSQLTFTSALALVFVLLAIFLPQTITISMPVFLKSIAFGTATVPLNVLLLVLCGLCTSIMWGGIFNLAVEGLGKYTKMASGIFMMLVVGGGVLPLIQGWVADLGGTESFASYINSYWVIIAGLAYLLFYALAGSKNVNTDIPVEE